jgi:predicted amino acid racemase
MNRFEQASVRFDRRFKVVTPTGSYQKHKPVNKTAKRIGKITKVVLKLDTSSKVFLIALAIMIVMFIWL